MLLCDNFQQQKKAIGHSFVHIQIMKIFTCTLYIYINQSQTVPAKAMIRNRILTLEKEVSPLSYQQLKDVPGSGYLKSFLIFTKNLAAKRKGMYEHKSRSSLCYGY